MPVLDREESIEQVYFFRAFRERVLDGLPSQDVLSRIGEELLSTTRLPLAVSFLATEIKVTGLMGPAMARLAHYFTPFQTFVISRAEEEVGSRFPMEQALLILEREARYHADGPVPAGLFVYQFEAISRNRLGYLRGLAAMGEDPFFDEPWRDFIGRLLSRLGDVDFADLIYVHSEWLATERRPKAPASRPPFPIPFRAKAAKLARPNHGRNAPTRPTPASRSSNRRSCCWRTGSSSLKSRAIAVILILASSPSSPRTPPASRPAGGRNHEDSTMDGSGRVRSFYLVSAALGSLRGQV